MGLKATFNATTRRVQLTEAPDGNGDVTFRIRPDLYSDGKEDWQATEALRKVLFPVRTVGGDPTPGGDALGDSYFIRSDWKIKPYEADHRLVVVGNLYSEDGSDPFLETVGDYTVKINLQISNIVNKIYISTGSGLSPEQDTKLSSIDTKTTTIDTRTAYQIKIVDNKRILIKVGSTWHAQVFDDNGSTVIQDKVLKDPFGNDISDLTAGVLAQELANSV